MAKKKVVIVQPETVLPPVSPAKAHVLKRFRSWYATKSRRYQVLFWLAILVIIALLIQLALQAGLSYQSLRSGDLSVFVEARDESISVLHGQNATIAFTLGTNNLPFCTAQCSWKILEVDSGNILDSGSADLSQGETETYEVTITSRSGEVVVPYQFVTSCVPKTSSLCKSSGKPSDGVALSVVNSVYTPAEKAAYDDLVISLPLWQTSASAAVNSLSGIASVSDVRAQDVSQQARAAQYVLSSQFTSIAASLSAKDLIQVSSQVAFDVDTSVVLAYDNLRYQEITLASSYSALRASLSLANAISQVASSADQTRLLLSVRGVEAAFYRFEKQPLSATQAAFDTYNKTLTNFSLAYGQSTIDKAILAQSYLSAEEIMACTLKAGNCALNRSVPTNLPSAVIALRTSCADYSQLSSFFANAQQLYGASLNATATQAELDAEYLVLIDSATADSLRSAARSGILNTTNSSIRYSIPLVVSSQSNSFFASNCKFANSSLTLPAGVLNASLPSDPSSVVSLPDLRLPSKIYCSSDGCYSARQGYPVVFVHGHSFSSEATPEYSLQAFAPMALELQNEGMLFAGNVFPREAPRILEQNELAGIPNVMFTTTYYYDSYPEEGEVSFVARKSENIETYAIRLKEAIDVVRYKTGSEKVIIVSHSMGGLVSRRYLQLFGDDNAAALVMIGTPNKGITDRILSLCPVFGGEKECDDMDSNSIFIAKLNAGRPPTIPVYTIAGVGCDGDFDGVIYLNSVQLSFANNTAVNGTCPSTNNLLHGGMLDTELQPEVYNQIKEIIKKYS